MPTSGLAQVRKLAARELRARHGKAVVGPMLAFRRPPSPSNAQFAAMADEDLMAMLTRAYPPRARMPTSQLEAMADEDLMEILTRAYPPPRVSTPRRPPRASMPRRTQPRSMRR